MAALLALHALPGLLLPAARAPARAPAAVMQKRAKIADFSDLEREVLSYLGTLNATQLNDESAPSPLAYVELQKAGRPDIVEACMEYGGYLAVSKRLGVRVRPSAPPAPPPSGPVLAGDERTSCDRAPELSGGGGGGGGRRRRRRAHCRSRSGWHHACRDDC